MTNPSFSGIIPPVVTPFDQHGEFDETSAKAIIDHLIEAKVDGLFFLGSTGEFSQMNTGLRKEITEFVTAYVDKRTSVLIGTGSNTIKESIELSRFAEQMGADGIVVINPYYWKLSEKELLRYFNSIANSTLLPMLLYNFPERTGQSLSADLVKKLVDSNPNIAGIKDTIDSIAHIKDLILTVKSAHPQFAVLCGYDDHLLNTLFMGGDGGIIGTSNFAPELFTGLYSAYQANDFQEVKKKNDQILRLSQIYKNNASILSVIKECLIQKDFNLSPSSLGPFSEVDENGKANIKGILQNLE
ncbi:dihydrodipicolinate synthase family protein [Planococcus lenghuensis]|uniref:Dihydrodipicolinate synthase family protein n=1 Tax=Planococcus lenghuensis TaxID=2213202 RepID=A0A1Q2L145_9BACL|nr:dihydrodipicolinate synthase family protein [Planococcus lenghuensis]AQQ54178.1 dihydrodipicolinate synthase family protein [Planococcus lenghuensis]